MQECKATIIFRSTRDGEEYCIDCARIPWCAKRLVKRDRNASDIEVSGECWLDPQPTEEAVSS